MKVTSEKVAAGEAEKYSSMASGSLHIYDSSMPSKKFLFFYCSKPPDDWHVVELLWGEHQGVEVLDSMFEKLSMQLHLVPSITIRSKRTLPSRVAYFREVCARLRTRCIGLLASTTKKPAGVVEGDGVALCCINTSKSRVSNFLESLHR